LLHLEAGGAGAALLRHERAKGVLVPLSVVGQLPRFHRAQHDRQSGGVTERALVILVHFRTGEDFDQAFAGIHFWLFLFGHITKFVLVPPK
jgi:hypothetical protein